jgi:hypothetical protein
VRPFYLDGSFLFPSCFRFKAHPSSANEMLKGQLRSPIIASVMQNRAEALAITGFVFVQGALVLAGLPGWPCPVKHLLGIPCPGCGLTRASTALLHGDWHTSFAFHAFAPLFLLTLALIVLASLLPERPRRSLIATVETVEQRTGMTFILLLGLMLYWLIRLLLFPETSALLVGR